MEIFTPTDAARNAGTKYRSILVAARFARYLNEFPKDRQVQWTENERAASSPRLHAEAGPRRAEFPRAACRPLRGLIRWTAVTSSSACRADRVLQELRSRPRLTEAGARVDVVFTAGVAEFVRPVTFEALSGRPVLTSLWGRDGARSHPAGQGPIWSSWRPYGTCWPGPPKASRTICHCPVAGLNRSGAPGPAMNDAMFSAPPTRKNLALLEERGWAIVGPEAGPLAERPSDRPGRMSEPESILRHALRLLGRHGPLHGKEVVVTAGPTRESLDPVRVVSNRSSGDGIPPGRGRMAAVRRSAGHRPVSRAAPEGVTVERVGDDRGCAMRARALPEADVLIGRPRRLSARVGGDGQAAEAGGRSP
jgi:phosphopantothenoylcysteine decarboxylase/phosphopantothenate--cysteine ligase